MRKPHRAERGAVFECLKLAKHAPKHEARKHNGGAERSPIGLGVRMSRAERLSVIAHDREALKKRTKVSKMRKSVKHLANTLQREKRS